MSRTGRTKGGKNYPAYQIVCEWCGKTVWKPLPYTRFCCSAHQQRAKRQRLNDHVR